MKPTPAAAFGLAALLALAPLSSAFAQEAQPAPEAPAAGEAQPGAAPEAPAEDQAPPESGIEAPFVAADSMNPFLRGEQTIAIGAGLHIPLFIAPGTATTTATNLSLGGAFSFSYQYFIARGLAIGGSVAGAFNNTVGGLSLFTAPLAFTGAYWWSLAPFEFNVGAGIGAYLSRMDSNGMIGPFAKVGGGAFYRLSSWSVGLESYFWFMPEIHSSSNSDKNRYAGFLQVGASAVYHL